MSNSVITSGFSTWLAERISANEPARPDKMIFAYVDGLDENAEPDPDEAMPPESGISCVTDITQYGIINDSAFVCSVVLDSTVGNWRYNWIGLVDSASDTLLMIVHTGDQEKIKTAGGVQGNTITRNLMMEFTGAASASQITVTAETWQIDYSARLAGIDERQRIENIDIYGQAAFFGDGWLVAKQGGKYFVTAGTGYVAGLRAELTENRDITVSAMPAAVWVDVCWTGKVTSAWGVESKIVIADTLENYVGDDGAQHYVFVLAFITSNGEIMDLRPQGTLSQQHADGSFLRIDQNGSDIADSGAFRASLGLGTAATKDAVTSATDTTAGRIPTVGWMGLGSIAPRTAPVAAFNYDNIPTKLPSGFWTHTLSGGPYAYTFTLYQDGGGTMQSRHFIIPATPTGKIAFRWDGATGASTLDYQFFYTDKNPPTAANVGALPITGGSLTGQLVSAYPAVTGVAQIQARTIDGNGAGDGFTHIGYNTGTTASPSYSHYFRGKGSTNINTTGGLNVTFSASVGGNITASGTITPGSYSNFDSRYLKLVGGKLTGNLEINHNAPIITLSEADTGKKYFIVADGSGFRINEDSTAGNVVLSYAGASKQLKTAGQFVPGDWANFDARYQAKGNFYTKTESDARYVQDIDHTAAVEKEFWDGRPYSTTHTTDGAHLANIRFVGGMSNAGWFIVRYTRKKINNVWYTLS